MGVIGENIELGLSNQIKIRQEKLGAPIPDTDTIVYTNSKTSWLRVASSVNINNINEARLDGLGVGSGNQLAKNLILAGAPTNSNGSIPDKALTTSTLLSEQIKSSYSVGGNDSKWNPTPPPGVESVEIQALNRGAIRKGKIKLKAYNPDQFRLIEALYLRLGFTILVEWGHTMYYDNNGNLQNLNNFSTTPLNNFLEGNGDFSSISEDLIDERKRKDYNYDGFLGYVSNFNWNFNSDGSYSIVLDVISRGGLIDSLTMNRSGNTSANYDGTSAVGSIIGKSLSYWYKVLKKVSRTNDAIEGAKGFYINTPDSDGSTLFKFNLYDEGRFGELERMGMRDNIHSTSTSEDASEKDFYYISLGLLCRFISERCLVYTEEMEENSEENSTSTKRKSLIKINSKYEQSWMLSHPFQQSVDPRICRLNNSTPKVDKFTQEIDAQGNQKFELLTIEKQTTPKNASTIFRPGTNPFPTGKPTPVNNPFCGDIMGIMVNMNYVVQVINKAKDKDNNLGIKDFLQSLLDGISSVIGGINDFNVSYSEETNTIEIYDDRTIPGFNTSPSPTPIHVFGFNKGSSQELGSFVTSLNFSSKIFPKIQNAVAIAAQNPNEPAGEQISSYQRLNRGVTDRISKGAKDYYSYEGTGPQPPYRKYQDQLYDLCKFFGDVYNKRTLTTPADKIEEYTIALKDVLNYDLQWRVGEGEISSPFFIPVELNIELDGIAGFKLYEKFGITPDEILPPSYPDNVNFIVQGVSHKLSQGKWTTSLAALSWPAEQSREFTFTGGIISKGPNPTSTPEEDNPSTATPLPPPPPPTSPGSEPILVADSSTLTENFGIPRNTPLTPTSAVRFIHPQVRNQQRSFLQNLLSEPKLKGYKIAISSTLRTFPQQDRLYKNGTTTAPAGTSQHNYGCAFDINIYDQETNTLICSNNTPGPKSETMSIWNQLGIVDAAKRAGVRSWGGNFSSYFDPVHFGVRVNTVASLQTAKEYAVQKGVSYKSLGVDDIFSLDITLV